jgi:hypothetical protein
MAQTTAVPPKRVHFYHADATALGGNIVRPFETLIDVQAPLSLPPVGGYAAVTADEFQLEKIISFKSAKTQVAGSRSKTSGGWTTLVTSSVDFLNVQDVLTADQLVAQIATEHPEDGYEPKVSFLGTKFENLRIGGEPVDLVLDLNLLSPDGDVYPTTPHLADSRFSTKVEEQYRNIVGSENTPQWVKDRYKWDNASQLTQRGFALCSIVQQANGDFQGTPCGHVIEVPNFGKLFLGELIVHRNAFQLVMIRLELGSPVAGDVSVAAAKSNGRTNP